MPAEGEEVGPESDDAEEARRDRELSEVVDDTHAGQAASPVVAAVDSDDEEARGATGDVPSDEETDEEESA